jgi:hypothetical protein
MVLTRALTRRICRVLIGVFAFAQLAVAGYVCASPESPREPVAAMAEHDSMAGCEQIDTSAANLCSEHCKFGQQSSNPAPALGAMAPTTSLLYLLSSPDEAVAAGILPSKPDPLLAAAPPPHAILHCVLRI